MKHKHEKEHKHMREDDDDNHATLDPLAASLKRAFDQLVGTHRRDDDD